MVWPQEGLWLWQWGAGGLACLQCPTPTLPGRLHHQAGDLHPGAPEGHRGRGHWHRLCTGAGLGQGGHWWVQGHKVLVAVATHTRFTPQVFGMIFTCCLYKSLKLEHY